MAQRRMFSLKIIDTDQFLEMPISSRLLYYELGMRADDDGFINDWKKIIKFSGLSEDDLRVLIAKKYIIPFDTGVIVIKHWRMNNYLRNDRYSPTQYQKEYEKIVVDDNLVYQMDTNGIHRLGKVSIGNNILGGETTEKKVTKTVFKPPTLEEVKEYCEKRNNGIDPQHFIDFYESKGWYVGKNKMKSWEACIRTWEKNHTKQKQPEVVEVEEKYEWI